MESSSRVSVCVAILFISLISGCATVVSGRNKAVEIRSTPAQAEVAVHNDEGQMVARGTTPMKVELKPTKGLLRRPAHYTATIEKPGYMSKEVGINSKINPWIAGNLLLGGGIGLIADAASGAAWRMTPGEINTKLRPMGQQEQMAQSPLKRRKDSARADEQLQQVTFVSDE